MSAIPEFPRKPIPDDVDEREAIDNYSKGTASWCGKRHRDSGYLCTRKGHLDDEHIAALHPSRGEWIGMRWKDEHIAALHPSRGEWIGMRWKQEAPTSERKKDDVCTHAYPLNTDRASWCRACGALYHDGAWLAPAKASIATSELVQEQEGKAAEVLKSARLAMASIDATERDTEQWKDYHGCFYSMLTARQVIGELCSLIEDSDYYRRQWQLADERERNQTGGALTEALARAEAAEAERDVAKGELADTLTLLGTGDHRNVEEGIEALQNSLRDAKGELAEAERHVREHIDDKHRILGEYEVAMDAVKPELSACMIRLRHQEYLTDALQSNRKVLEKELETARANFLAVASALGIVYEADGHPVQAGPLEAVVEAARTLVTNEAALWERLDTVERQRDAAPAIALRHWFGRYQAGSRAFEEGRPQPPPFVDGGPVDPENVGWRDAQEHAAITAALEAARAESASRLRELEALGARLDEVLQRRLDAEAEVLRLRETMEAEQKRLAEAEKELDLLRELAHAGAEQLADSNRAELALLTRSTRLRAEVEALEKRLARATASLAEISQNLPCETPCNTEPIVCPTCDRNNGGHWCAGCVARRGMMGTSPSVEEQTGSVT